MPVQERPSAGDVDAAAIALRPEFCVTAARLRLGNHDHRSYVLLVLVFSLDGG